MQGVVTISTPIELPQQNLFIGSYAVPIFYGEISDFVISTRALSQDEISSIYREKRN